MQYLKQYLKKPSVNLIAEKDVISIMSFDQIQLIKSSIQYNKPLNAPITKGDKLGIMLIDIPGKQTIELNLIAEESIGNINPLFKIFSAIKYLIFGTSLDEI